MNPWNWLVPSPSDDQQVELAAIMEKYALESTSAASRAVKIIGSKFGVRYGLVLDPTLRFRISKKKVIAANRTRKRRVAEYHGTVYLDYQKESHIRYCSPTILNRNLPEQHTDSKGALYTLNKGTNSDSYDVMDDTTQRTRGPDTVLGTCRRTSWKNLSLPSKRSYEYYIGNVDNSTSGPNQWNYEVDKLSVNVYPFAGFLDTSAVDALRTAELARCDYHIAQNGLRMLSQALPNHREMNLFRELVELRDLPRSVQRAFDLLRGRVDWNKPISELGKEHLDIQFGWMPVIDDVKKLLELPRTLPLRAKRLQDRYFKDSTFHYQYGFTEDGGGTVMQVPYQGVDETQFSIGCRNIRNVKLRATVNANVRFPDILPGLPEQFSWIRLAGLDPTLSDLWKLIPWTWLIDWFADFGSYVENVCNFNSEPSVINWGVVACECTNSLETIARLRCQKTTYRWLNWNASFTYDYLYRDVIAKGELTSYVRADASKLNAVPCVSTLTGLSQWQSAILGALFASKYL